MNLSPLSAMFRFADARFCKRCIAGNIKSVLVPIGTGGRELKRVRSIGTEVALFLCREDAAWPKS